MSTTTATTTATANPNTPVQGGTAYAVYGWAFSQLAGNLDPLTITAGPNPWSFAMFDRLLTYGTYPSTDLLPQLADSYDISSDGLTVTWHLHPGVTWHNGDPFTASDVAYTFNAILDPKTASIYQSDYAAFLDHASADTNSTATWHMKAATPGVQLFAASYEALIVPAKRANDVAGFKANPYGNGAFKFNGVNVSGSYISFLPNPNYWNGAPYLGELRWSGTVDAQAMLAGIQSGQFDWSETDVVLGPSVAQVGTFGNSQILLQESPVGQWDVTMQTQNSPFADVNVRKAVVMGINWPAILALYGGLQGTKRAYAPVSETYWAFGPNTPKINYDATAAQQLLSTTSVKNGQQITFIIYAGRKTSERDIIISSLQNLGFVVNLKIVDTDTFYSSWVIPSNLPVKNAWDITMQSNGSPVPDPDPVFRSYYQTNNAGWNPGHYSNTQVDALLTSGITTIDSVERAKIYQQICEITTAAFVYPGTYGIHNHDVLNNNFKGVHDYSSLYIQDFSKAWLANQTKT